MAALALRPMLPTASGIASRLFAQRLLASSTLAFFLPNTAAWSLSSTLETLKNLFPPFLLAVPKKKVSHSRKAMRSANKGLEDKLNLVSCPACGSPKLSHHLCSHCYSALRRSWRGGPSSEARPS